MNSQEAYTYCRDAAERFDRDRYILTLAAPAGLRPALWAILAFNHEIAKVRDVSTGAITGHIRLSWWRDAMVDGKYSHEVLTALRDAIMHHDLPVSWFIALIDARMRDADNTPPPALDLYASQTNLPLLWLFRRTLGSTDDDNTLNHLATAYGLTGLMRSLSYFIRHDDRMLPLDVLSNIGIAPEQFSHIRAGDKLSSYVRSVARQAQIHLDQAVPQDRVFKSMKKMTGLYLKNIYRAQCDPFNPKYNRAIPFLGLRILIQDH